MRLKMRDMIKEAFSNKRDLKSKWDSQTQPNAYALDVFLRKSGYRLVDMIPQIVDEQSVPELLIEPIKEDYKHPEITHLVDDGIFCMKMKSYGELPASDVDTIIQVYQNVLAVLTHLDELDLAKLEYEEAESADTSDDEIEDEDVEDEE